MRPRSITVAEVEYTAFKMAEEFMTWNEPIPEFGSRFPNILESCLAVPFSGFGGKDLYRGLVGKASMLFYLLIKNHPFRNGNKRIAIMCLLYFLHKNDYWIYITNERLYKFAQHVAASRPQKREAITKHINEFLKLNVKNLKLVIN